MKIALDESFPELTNLLRKIEAREISWVPAKPTLPKEEFTIEVNPASYPEITNDIFVNPKKLIAYEGIPCLIYIPQGTLFSIPEDLPKFHFMECSTIKDMRRNGRFQRYIITNETSGRFVMNMRDNWHSAGAENNRVRLNVCKNCLREYNYKNYNASRDKDAIVRNFDIKSFFGECEVYFDDLPLRHDANFIKDNYPKNWDAISLSYRNSIGWCCEICHAVFSEHRHLLGVHHRNGIKSDVDVANLQALCKVCHSEQFMHQHLSITETERQIIEELRKKSQDAIRMFAS
ncbi:MAG: HNH endonuclease [Synergistaceae bacterium]|nr:HNH endonuclease [Synergistaceae bacterium]